MNSGPITGRHEPQDQASEFWDCTRRRYMACWDCKKLEQQQFRGWEPVRFIEADHLESEAFHKHLSADVDAKWMLDNVWTTVINC